MHSRHGLRRFGMFAAIPLAVFSVVLIYPFAQGLFLTFTNWDGFEYDKFAELVITQSPSKIQNSGQL